MKIDANNNTSSEAVSQTEKKDAPVAAARGAKKKHPDFKTLLKKTARKAPAGKKQPEAARAAPENQAQNEFGARLHDGRVQVGEQAAQARRVDAQLEQVGQRHERQVDQRGAREHVHRLGTDAERTDQVRTTRSLDASAAKAVEVSQLAQRPGASARAQTPDEVNAPAEVNAQPRAEAQAPARTDQAAPAERSQAREEATRLAHELINQAHVGADAEGRQIMLLDLEVPGRGHVRVRLRRRGDSFELRMRPENQNLARDLRLERETFRQAAAERGVAFSSIEIV